MPHVPKSLKVAVVGDSFQKIVLVRDVVKPTYDQQGILNMCVYDFLLDPASLSSQSREALVGLWGLSVCGELCSPGESH